MSDPSSAIVMQRILDYIEGQCLPPRHPLSAQKLADIFGVSRAPVEAALRLLGQAKILSGNCIRGFFVASPSHHDEPSNINLKPVEDDVYFQVAEDRLSKKLSRRVSESQLMRRYGVGRTTIQRLLHQISQEGWIERRSGHGWEFKDTMSSAEGYEEAYRFRAILESQALLQPGFAVDTRQLSEARRQQNSLMAGEMFSLPRERLFQINSEFHELISSWSNNKFFLDTLVHINRLRRLIEYRVSLDRSRLAMQCREHLTILAMLEAGDHNGASLYLKAHIDRAWTAKESSVTSLIPEAPAG